jgi:hypothetical protein
MNAIIKTNLSNANINIEKPSISDNFENILGSGQASKKLITRDGAKIALNDFLLGSSSEANKEPQLKGCTLEVTLSVEDKNEIWKRLPNGKVLKVKVPEQDRETLNEYTYRYTTKKAKLNAPKGYSPYLRMVSPKKNINPRWNSKEASSVSIRPNSQKAELGYNAIETPDIATYNRHIPDIFTDRAMNPEKDIYFEAYCEENSKTGKNSFKATQVKNEKTISKKEYLGN